MTETMSPLQPIESVKQVEDIARRAEALTLMLDALAMLDSMGEHLAASHLSLAIIGLGGEPPFPD
ncbi:MAG TPA: hypothetical protein VF509_10095 [Sphingobium sp.]